TLTLLFTEHMHLRVINQRLTLIFVAIAIVLSQVRKRTVESQLPLVLIMLIIFISIIGGFWNSFLIAPIKEFFPLLNSINLSRISWLIPAIVLMAIFFSAREIGRALRRLP